MNSDTPESPARCVQSACSPPNVPLTGDERQLLARLAGETVTELGFWYIHEGRRWESWGNSPEYTVHKCGWYQRDGMEAGLIERLVEDSYEESLDAIQRVMLRLSDDAKASVNRALEAGADSVGCYIWELSPLVWCRAVLSANAKSSHGGTPLADSTGSTSSDL